jgi:uncharacterized membrane protein
MCLLEEVVLHLIYLGMVAGLMKRKKIIEEGA